MAARRWILFATALVSLLFLTWAGVLLAFSVRIDEHAASFDPELGAADRAVVVPPRAPALVPTFQTHGADGAWLALGEKGGSSFPSGATDVSLLLALAYAAPDANGTYAAANLTDVPARNGTTNLTLDVAGLAGGGTGYLALDPRDESVRFVPTDAVLGEVVALETSAALALRFIVGAFGFVVPLLALMLTHKASKRTGAAFPFCHECRAPMGASSAFCVRCGAYAKEARADA